MLSTDRGLYRTVDRGARWNLVVDGNLPVHLEAGPLVRDPVYYGRFPALPTVAIALACAVIALVGGFAVFTRLEPRHIHHL